MANKIVNASALDTALGYTANRLRAKTGDSASIAFDMANGKGFGDAVDAMPSNSLLDKLIYFNDFNGHEKTTADFPMSEYPSGAVRNITNISTELTNAGCPYSKMIDCGSGNITEFRSGNIGAGFSQMTWGMWVSLRLEQYNTSLMAWMKDISNLFRIFKENTSTSGPCGFRPDVPSANYKMYDKAVSSGIYSWYMYNVMHVACTFISDHGNSVFAAYVNGDPVGALINKESEDKISQISFGRTGYNPYSFTGLFASPYVLSQAEIRKLAYSQYPFE